MPMDQKRVLEIMLEEPQFIAAVARGSGETEAQVRQILQKMIAERDRPKN